MEAIQQPSKQLGMIFTLIILYSLNPAQMQRENLDVANEFYVVFACLRWCNEFEGRLIQ